MSSKLRIAVIGLGYVGLPLAVGLSRHFSLTGFDSNRQRIEELKSGTDLTGEVRSADLASATLDLSSEKESICAHDVYIITVPTPVDAAKRPDLSAIRAACATVGKGMEKGAVVVCECTVYPGVTEGICGPELEKASGLVSGRDFFLGYSPERINPGDKEHSVERITKVIAGQTPETTGKLIEIYGALTGGDVFVARDIRTAEAAKVIENAQRDINIAFINEVTMIFGHLGISIYDVLEASATKWNFLNFRPGLVGGHCIGIDPYYLSHLAQDVGHDPEIILAGRRINDGMGAYVAGRIDEALSAAVDLDGGPRTLVLGLTFKENVPDLRNTKVVDLVERLSALGHRVDVHDPAADPAEAEDLYGIKLLAGLDGAKGYDCVVGAVPHRAYLSFGTSTFAELLPSGGLLADIKGIWRRLQLPEGVKAWRL